MDRKIGLLGRDPALIIGVIAAVLGTVATFNIPGLGTAETAGIVVVLNALFAAWTAAHVRPIAPAAFTYALGTIASLAGLWGFHIPPETVGALNGVIVAVLAAVAVRPQVEPVPGALVSGPKTE